MNKSPDNPLTARHSADTVLADLAPVVPAASGKDLAAMESLTKHYHQVLRERALRLPVLYHLVRELGKGRQGVVFLGERQGGRGCLTRHAIKIHDPAIYSSPDVYWSDMARIATQISKLQPIHSDSLVPQDIYDEYNGIGYIQMAAIDGIDLQFLLEGTHLGIARSQSSDEEWEHFMRVLFRIEQGRVMLYPGAAFYILRKVLLGLTVLHEAGYLHADIKPSNVMIDQMGSVKLVDFGRAVIIGEPISILLGSPFYMAPETHRLEPGQPQSDLYGAGFVALEMLLGEPVVNDGCVHTEQDLLDFKMSALPHIDELFVAQLPGQRLLAEVLKSFVQPDPRQRYTTAEEAEEICRQALSGLEFEGSLRTDAEYDREFHHYLEKIADPDTRRINPRLD